MVKKLGEKAEAELKIALDKYYHEKNLSDKTEMYSKYSQSKHGPVIEK